MIGSTDPRANVGNRHPGRDESSFAGVERDAIRLGPSRQRLTDRRRHRVLPNSRCRTLLPQPLDLLLPGESEAAIRCVVNGRATGVSGATRVLIGGPTVGISAAHHGGVGRHRDATGEDQCEHATANRRQTKNHCGSIANERRACKASKAHPIRLRGSDSTTDRSRPNGQNT